MASEGQKNNAKNLAKPPRPLVFALDEEWKHCGIWVDRLESEIWGFKVGSILFTEKGPWVIDFLKSRGLRVFLDLKFHDIPNTVGHAVESAFRQGVDWLTVHSLGGLEMLQKAAEKQTEHQRVLAVTVLTSHSEESFSEIGFEKKIESSVSHLVELGIRAGLKSFVCSAHELKLLQKQSSELMLVTPGLRLESSADDQKRVATYREALDWGASAIVLGRDLRQAKDWEQAWENIKSSMDGMS